MKRGRLNLFYYGPLVGWMALIFVMSTGVGQDEDSKALIRRILQWATPDLVSTFTGDQLRFLDYVLRKTGHVTEYFVLFCLAVRAFQYGRPNLRWQSSIGALALCAVYALSDEFHQYFVAGRTGTIVDVAIDCIGAMVGLITILGWFAAKQAERALWRQAGPETTEAGVFDPSVEIARVRSGIRPPAPNPGGDM